ncbi:MAG: metallophosphoesterase [Desulfobacterales bacterium]
MRKIIHLSDIHIGYKDMGTRFDRIVTQMIFHNCPGNHYLVLITGDMVDDATKDGSYEEACFQISRLKKEGFRVLTVPGNHDYGSGVLGHPKYVEKYKEYFFEDISISYPKLDLVGNIALLGLDSMAEELHWYDRVFAEGELGDRQLERLKNLLESDSVQKAACRVVYLHHHPFHPTPAHHLKDSEKLGAILKQYPVDALLFGHNHEGKVWNGEWGIKRVYDAGSATGKGGKVGPHRIIDLSKDPFFDYDAQFSAA